MERWKEVGSITFVSSSGRVKTIEGISDELLVALEMEAAKQGLPLADFVKDWLRRTIHMPPKSRVH